MNRLRQLVARAAPLAAGRRRAVAVIVLASVASGMAEAAVLGLIAHIASGMSSPADEMTLTFGPLEFAAETSALFGAAACLAVLRLVLQLLLARLPARMSAAVMTELRTELFDAYLRSSWSEQAREREGHLQELMGGQTQVAGSAVLHLTNAITAVLAFGVLALSALVLSVAVALTVIVTALALFAILRPLSRRVRTYSAASSAASVAQASGVAESVRMAEEVRVFGAADAERARITDLVRRFEFNIVRQWSLSRIVPVLYQSSVIFLLIGGLALLYALGSERLAALGAVVLLLVRASAHGQQLQTALQGLAETSPYMDRIANARSRYRSRPDPLGHLPFHTMGEVEFEGIEFEYRRDEPVLRGLSFRIVPGEAIGVVGPSGAGKSTLVQVLLRLRQPTNGRYRVGGVDACDIDASDWRRRVSYLPQSPHVLSGTVAENIRFFRPGIDDDGIVRAARLAHIHDEIESWDGGYEAVIGDRADAISGGQRQRICLARALAGDPWLLVLDEPTSALDGQSERLIQESLEGLRGNLTLVIVAHRLSTINYCDRIMVVQEGLVGAFSTSDDLYRSNEFFRRAVDLAAEGQII